MLCTLFQAKKGLCLCWLFRVTVFLVSSLLKTEFHPVPIEFALGCGVQGRGVGRRRGG
jgi:hypothetical protein